MLFKYVNRINLNQLKNTNLKIIMKLYSKLFIWQSCPSDKAGNYLFHGFRLIQTPSQTGSFNWDKSEALNFPYEPTNLILSLVFPRNPPLPPVLQDRKFKLVFKLRNPFFGWGNRYFRIQITRVNPLNYINKSYNSNVALD